jgi:hypothetical protein
MLGSYKLSHPSCKCFIPACVLDISYGIIKSAVPLNIRVKSGIKPYEVFPLLINAKTAAGSYTCSDINCLITRGSGVSAGVIWVRRLIILCKGWLKVNSSWTGYIKWKLRCLEYRYVCEVVVTSAAGRAGSIL